jgi:hypothetical protein
MKNENVQSYVTNEQFSGGRNIGSGSVNNLSYSSGSFLFSSTANYTGSFSIRDQYYVTSRYYLTGSTTASASFDAATNIQSYYLPVTNSIANTITKVVEFLNASASSAVSASGTATNLNLTSSINGGAGSTVAVTLSAYSGSVVTGSNTSILVGGAGLSDFPYDIPFTACGLYVGQGGTLVATTVDKSVVTFVSASGFIPGLFTAVSSSSNCRNIVALK